MSRLPAEWEPHAATWLCWPHNRDTWPDGIDEAEREFARFAAVLAEHERVEILVRDAEHLARVRDRTAPGVQLHIAENQDCWLRDTGPTFVQHAGRLLAVDWTFNAWGGKYPAWQRDDLVAGRVAEIAGVPQLRESLVLEGGALETDGEGTLLLTRSSVLGRNPGLARASLEERLRRRLGTDRMIWLDAELAGDDTDAHIDQIARFVAPGRVVCARASDPESPDRAPLDACLAALRASRDARGRALEVIELPLPARLEVDGQPLPASHANFYIANGIVVVPGFGGDSDAEAERILAPLFPGRELVVLPSLALVRGLGSFHCLSQQQPEPSH